MMSYAKGEGILTIGHPDVQVVAGNQATAIQSHKETPQGRDGENHAEIEGRTIGHHAVSRQRP
jgi:hypothetical protein